VLELAIINNRIADGRKGGGIREKGFLSVVNFSWAVMSCRERAES